MKKKIIIANWKMNLGLPETKILTKEILAGLEKNPSILERLDLVFCPAFPLIHLVKSLINESKKFKNKIAVGAQDVFWEEAGAYTGEVSPRLLYQLGCRYVIIGHSERREILKETDEMVHQKAKTCLLNHLIPIVCVGETFDERQKGLKDLRVIIQVSGALEGVGLETNQNIIIAYEPVWVIGSGQAVDPTEAEYTHRVILQRLIDFYSLPIVKNNIHLIYGGSVDSKNIKKFLEQETIDGALIGGASLKAEEFLRILSEVQ